MKLTAKYVPSHVTWEVGPITVTASADGMQLVTWPSPDNDRIREEIDDLIAVLGAAKEVYLDMRALEETTPKETN